jgi:hypothetical protein
MGARTAHNVKGVTKNYNIQKSIYLIHHVVKHFACGMYVELLTTFVWPLVDCKFTVLRSSKHYYLINNR